MMPGDVPCADWLLLMPCPPARQGVIIVVVVVVDDDDDDDADIIYNARVRL